MDPVLEILRHDARTTVEDIARMTALSPEDVADRIASYEKQGVIRGYRALVNDDRLSGAADRVTAVIEA